MLSNKDKKIFNQIASMVRNKFPAARKNSKMDHALKALWFKIFWVTGYQGDINYFTVPVNIDYKEVMSCRESPE